MQSQPLNKIERKLGLNFKNKNLLKKALTHSSIVTSNRAKCNETLEFLGDAVLELIVREFLIKKFPDQNEGELNQLKKRYTCEEILCKIGKRLGIGEYLIMDKGEDLTGGRQRCSNISGGVEALFGAIFLDRGLEYARKYFQKIFSGKRFNLSLDYKSLLNQWAMKNKKEIDYNIIKEEGPPHKKIFYVALYINGKEISHGKGNSRKDAEQSAARFFLKNVKKKNLTENHRQKSI
ncbi:MAG: ribonuclease III [bacterium]